MLASGRRTAASWLRYAGVKDDWDRHYELLHLVGKTAESLMLPLLMFILKKFDLGPEGYWTLAIDDSPTKRFGDGVDTMMRRCGFHHLVCADAVDSTAGRFAPVAVLAPGHGDHPAKKILIPEHPLSQVLLERVFGLVR